MKDKNAAVVLQARMGSKRLPGKVLELIDGRTVFAHCVDRLRARSGLPVILATTTHAEDDRLVAAADRLGVPSVRGDENDVLSRYVLAATTFELVEVIRATADNPAVDMDAPRRLLDLLRRTRADYVSERGLPYGAAVEAVLAEALYIAHASTGDLADREHVTPFVRRSEQFQVIYALSPGDVRRPHLRLTVDTRDDLDFMRRVLVRVANSDRSPAPLAAIIAAAERVIACSDEPGEFGGRR